MLQDIFKKESDEFEKKNLGNFDRIYPLALEDAKEKAEKAQQSEKLSQVQK